MRLRLGRAAARVEGAALALGLISMAIVGVPGSGSATPSPKSTSRAVSMVKDPASLVNPMIGTGSGGQVVGDVDTFPGADVPFGMMQWSPDTSPDRTDGGGYSYADKQISGFSLTHISGPGCSAFGDVPILPTVGAIGTDPNSTTEPFGHRTEQASAGYYRVQTGTQPVTTELTVTKRTGIGSFRFPAGTRSNLIIKAGASASGETGSTVRIIGDNEVEGSATAGQFCGATDQYTVHYVIQFKQAFTSAGTWNGSKVTPGAPAGAVSGTNTGAWVTFDTSNSPVVLAKVGISFTSGANAALNLKTEDPGWRFDSVKASAAKAWNAVLGQMLVGGGTKAQQQQFYTGIYHAVLHPNVFSDVNGQYMGSNGKTATVAQGHADYANFSGWDIYRSQVQLAALVDPSAVSDIVRSMQDDYRQTGEFPKWSLANGESYVMVGDPADGIIADAYAFGAHAFDTKTALADMQAEATKSNNVRPGLNYLEKLGYLPANGTYGCCNYYGDASTTLEYDTADSAIASFAQAIGSATVARRFASRAQDWQNLYNPANGFIEPKMADGQFVSDFDPTSQADYVEGDAYQYRWMVPFNLRALVAAEGGNADFTRLLNTYFTQLNAGPDSPYYWAGNEPNLGDAWEYDYSGAPYRTQATVRKLITSLYSDSPGGEPGNDDLGAMSSWYVWAALGLYPETPGSSVLVTGSPLFPRAVVRLATGKRLVINAAGAGTKSPYVHSLAIDGKATEKDWMSATDLVSRTASLVPATTTMTFTLGPRPDKTWGSAASDAPPSASTGEQPAIAYLATKQLDVAPGSSSVATVGVRNVTDRSQTVTIKATAPTGLRVKVSPARFVVPAHGLRRAQVKAGASSHAIQTWSSVAMTFKVGTSTLPRQTLTVLVAKAGSLLRYFDNTGISANRDQTAADFDGGGYSYSAEALAAVRLTPGAKVTSAGVDYTWPDSPAGDPDNVTADGQTIPVSASPGDAQLGFLAAATDGPSAGPITLRYRDGTTSKFQLGLSDWTLNGGSSKPSFGNHIVATTTYRNSSVGSDKVATDVFSAAVPLDTAKTLESVTLPPSGAASLHIFALATSATPMAGPVVRSASPDPAAPGQTVTVAGSGFGATQGSGYVTFSDDGVNWGAPSNTAKLTVESWSDTAVTFAIPEPSGTGDQYHVTPGSDATVGVVSAAGDTSDATVVGITPTATLSDYFDNVGISSNTDTSSQACADLDGDGYSYSQQALARAGVTPGGAIRSGGLTYTWPNTAKCADDNVLADGQTLLVDRAKGDTKLGLIGCTTNGPATGTLTIHYRDGTTSTASVTLNDWAAGAGDGNAAVAKMAYRNSTAGVPQTLDIYVYATTVPLKANRVVVSVTMPDVGSATGNGAAAMHIFGLALGS